ncbi:DUF2917 domain-containing protein [Deefgea sp. CFH1-16]|uniref:DUF2917 domain-containing protein n=1 Tax=Deefgea sp. CFH1-16 TaxID=2675457 RepID=UPI0015F745F9|nr:DUF2917 domain-containing protein [Deefgea sp. CFH1-16]MBM5575577.1 DUF2917 domain-containing protein [Deefgea sp. CFH1-16]
MQTTQLNHAQVNSLQAKHCWIHCEAGQLWLSHDGEDIVLERGQKYFVHQGDLVVIEALQNSRYRVQANTAVSVQSAPKTAIPAAALAQ